MLYYNSINVSEENGFDKTSASKNAIFCHYWYSSDKGFKFQRHVCNRFHDVLMMSINLNDIAILNINSADFCCIINGISISDALNLLKKADLAKKGVL